MPMPVKLIETEIPGILVVETGIARDDRGFFTEVYSEKVWEEAGFRESFVQDNLSMSAKGTLRGMHYHLWTEMYFEGLGWITIDATPPDTEAADAELLEMTKLIRESQRALSLAIKPHGFNVGMNFGRCAGAGLPQHLHIHVVPRWEGDTNFMNVCSDAGVVSQSLIELLELLKKVSKENNLPNI